MCVDVETANESAGSICQVGIALFLNGVHAAQFDIETYVDPEDYFLEELTNIHGITAETVKGAPTFAGIHAALVVALTGQTVLCHSHFDRVSLRQACAKYDLPPIECTWLDTLLVARRAWPELRREGGHGLLAMAEHWGLVLNHHSALSDAQCCGEVFLKASSTSGYSLDQWLVRAKLPVNPELPNRLDGNPEGHLVGEVVVFTGQLSLSRYEMAQIAAQAGCRVDAGVTKHTSLVVVGIQDVTKLREGETISSKHQKARDLVAKGLPIRVITESDLLALVAH